jgi:plastocyanin
MTSINAVPARLPALLFGALVFAGGARAGATPFAVTATLSEWKVELSQDVVPPGEVTITVANAGNIPHALEVEGPGLERETATIQPGSTGVLTLTLQPGTYEVYCPVGMDSHKKLGMQTHLTVVASKGAAAPGHGDQKSGASGKSGRQDMPQDQAMQMKAMEPMAMEAKTIEPKAQVIEVTGGGPVIQILPGPFPFPDSAGPILRAFGEEHEALESQAQNGPYSNNVASISGNFRLTAWDLGATHDSVDGLAEFTTQDGARWKVVLDRVQVRDVPHHPKFGGVILGLYYHGATGVHTPLVPTINSAVAAWGIAHLYRNSTLVTDNAMVHVMLLSRTRRDGDFALTCWDCSRNPVEELQLQITPAPGEPAFAAPGGFLFANWEKSTSRTSAG